MLRDQSESGISFRANTLSVKVCRENLPRLSKTQGSKLTGSHRSRILNCGNCPFILIHNSKISSLTLSVKVCRENLERLSVSQKHEGLNLRAVTTKISSPTKMRDFLKKQKILARTKQSSDKTILTLEC